MPSKMEFVFIDTTNFLILFKVIHDKLYIM